MATEQFTEKLHNFFEGVPSELHQIDLVRAVRWSLGEETFAQVRCVTAPTGIEFPAKRATGEYSYPRGYWVDLAWQVAEDMFVASSGWAAQAPNGQLQRLQGGGISSLGAVGIDPFDLVDLASKTPKLDGEIILFRKDFVDPNIFTVKGVEILLNTNTDFLRAQKGLLRDQRLDRIRQHT